MISFVCVGPYHTSTNEFYSEIMKSVKVLPTLSILLPAVSVAQAARPLRGIRIVSPANPVTIYLNGERVLSVTNSCFIANLKSGDCRIEAYDGYGDNKRDGSPVFQKSYVIRAARSPKSASKTVAVPVQRSGDRPGVVRPAC